MCGRCDFEDPTQLYYSDCSILEEIQLCYVEGEEIQWILGNAVRNVTQYWSSGIRKNILIQVETWRYRALEGVSCFLPFPRKAELKQSDLSDHASYLRYIAYQQLSKEA